MEQELQPLGPNDKFTFNCSAQVRCFNECCRDINQFLTPYDILRLKNHMSLSSSEFLKRHTTSHTGPETGLPVVTLKTDPQSGYKCPFVTPEGCSVYADRPSSCRTYPLVRLASRSRETGEISERYMLLTEPHCLGFRENVSRTVSEWIAGQKIDEFNGMNDCFMEIIALKNKHHPGPLNIRTNHIFHMACYDSDEFKIHVFEKGLLKGTPVDKDMVEKARDDDAALLRLGFEWLKHALFQA